MAEQCNHLPDECWELILNRLDHRSHLEAPSLACKRFLSITNELRTHFVVNPTIFKRGGTLSKLFARFRHLKSIDLSGFHGDIDHVITEIAVSDLKLESLDVSNSNCLPLECLKLLGSKMKSLRVLKCSNLDVFRDIELVAIAESIPWLEELDISYPLSPGEVGLTDEGIKVLSSKLGVLRKINISGNDFLTDKSLFALSSNCVFLKEIVILHCSLVTPHGIEFVMRNSSQLSSISVGKNEISRSSLYYLPLFDSFTSARGLSTLYIHDSLVPDEFLYSLAKARFLLKRLSLSFCSNFTFSGISSHLYTHRSLEYLSFTKVIFLTDKLMSDLSKYLTSLVTIKLCLCRSLIESTFFTLAKNCPLLEGIDMGRINFGIVDRTEDIVKNPRIKSLKLNFNLDLTDKCLEKLASVCPSLEMLDLSHCPRITQNGVSNFLNTDSKVRNLCINGCMRIKNIGTGSELPKLEVFEAANSGIDDKGLAMIGNRCRRIMILDLTGCLGATSIGLKEILRNCRRLREINLNGCSKMIMESVDWMVFSVPSLKKIVVSDEHSITESQRRVLLGRGCLVSWWDAATILDP
ncbi:hypothetical protein U1Q18_006812 [Sarracenia purpurea var. burkii]